MNSSMKTAVTVLQELMVKFGQTPEYECIAQSGLQHSAMFEYRCIARGTEVKAKARSKKEAKQEAARRMLLALATRGDPVPPPYGICQMTQDTSGPSGNGTSSSVVPHSYVALLKDLCEEYKLPGVEYDLVGDTGPPHMRQFTMRVKLGQHERLAVASTKKAARQQAAEQLYTYMRENLARLTKDFVEEEALVRAHERAMERYVEMREEGAWRPRLGQRVAEYHLGLSAHIDEEKRSLAIEVINAKADTAEAEEAVEAAAAALGLTVSQCALAAEPALHVLELSPASPALAFAGRSQHAAAAAALKYLRLALCP